MGVWPSPSMYYCYSYVQTTISNIIIITHCLLIVGSQFLMVKKLSKMGAQLKLENCQAMVITAHKLGYNLSKNGSFIIDWSCILCTSKCALFIIMCALLFSIFLVLITTILTTMTIRTITINLLLLCIYYGHETIFTITITINVTHISATVAPCCF